MDLTTDKKIAKKLRQKRLKAGLSQGHMARFLDMSQNYLCELEAGKKRWLATDFWKYWNYVKEKI